MDFKLNKRILVVDDKKEKYFAVRRFFSSEYPKWNIEWSKHFRQAQNNLLATKFDLLILDMSFEIHGAASEDLTFNGLAGLHVLQFMWRTKISIPTVICTSHENYSDPDFGMINGIQDLTKYVQSVFGPSVLGCVLMTADEYTWTNDLKKVINNAAI